MKKMWLLSALLALPLVAAEGPLEFISGIWDKFLTIGSLSFIGVNGVAPFTRILIGILTFTIFFALLTFLGAGGSSDTKNLKFLQRKHAIVIAAVMAIMTALFLPVSVILGIGAGYATAIALALTGLPILGFGYLLWTIPEKGKETKGTVLLKLLLSMLLFWILSAMNHEVRVIGPSPNASVVGTMANFLAWALYIVTLMIIWYIIKFFITSSGGTEEADKNWQEGGENMRKWFAKRSEAQKVKEQMQHREDAIRVPRSHLWNAVDGAESLLKVIFGARTPEEKAAAVKKAEKHLKFMRKNLKQALRSLRQLRRKEKGETSTFFNTLWEHVAEALQAANRLHLPKADAVDWEAQKTQIHGVVIQNIRGVCGSVIKHLDEFMEHQKTQLSEAAAAQKVEQQAEQRAHAGEAAQDRAEQQAQERRRRMVSMPRRK